MKKCKCDLCGNELNELDMFHYSYMEGKEIIEVLVCEECLFELVGNDFCDGICT